MLARAGLWSFSSPVLPSVRVVLDYVWTTATAACASAILPQVAAKGEPTITSSSPRSHLDIAPAPICQQLTERHTALSDRTRLRRRLLHSRCRVPAPTRHCRVPSIARQGGLSQRRPAPTDPAVKGRDRVGLQAAPYTQAGRPGHLRSIADWTGLWCHLHAVASLGLGSA
jgi:hypothetical protein